MGEKREGPKHAAWRAEYARLDRDYETCEAQGIVWKAELVADRLSEMELMEPKYEE